ncbi:hypothetical protein XH83_33795 [Bradyrhizobium sp. CCBAU 53351]|uniref:hypothetical protein n=1 Tax=Bradyrhizobium sp. CCBAU 53351 TaxID=1325114 RepID=UPI001887E4E5|nr:hypothetical protein [Bradyrhizobium sp. CCBAU 53351]QOZ79920.1 hypothetical protein XH83_33795 [Bradyrhizobium sp. CCBAU 53351]
MPLSIFDHTGSRVRTDETFAAELAALPEAEREDTAEFISRNLDVEEIEAELTAAKSELAHLRYAEDRARTALAASSKVDAIDSLRRYIAASRQVS